MLNSSLRPGRTHGQQNQSYLLLFAVLEPQQATDFVIPVILESNKSLRSQALDFVVAEFFMVFCNKQHPNKHIRKKGVLDALGTVIQIWSNRKQFAHVKWNMHEVEVCKSAAFLSVKLSWTFPPLGGYLSKFFCTELLFFILLWSADKFFPTGFSSTGMSPFFDGKQQISTQPGLFVECLCNASFLEEW